MNDARREKPRRRWRRAAPVAAPLLPPKATLDATMPADAPLSEQEQADLKQHFAFIARYRPDLRLRANDAENLLITGAREPTDRGVCTHLLGKIDRALVNATLARVPDPARRTRILAGVVRFSRDVAVLLLYLESLGESASRAEAAATLVAALPELEYDAVSAAQMRRVLELMATLLPEVERPLLVLSLLRSAGFRAAFDRATEAMPASLAALFSPMRAVCAVAFAPAREVEGVDDAELERGLRLLLAGASAHLARLPAEARARLVEAAVAFDDLGVAGERAVAELLGSLPKDGRRFSTLATARARRLLAQGRDAEAKTLLEDLRANHPDYKLPGRWLSALEAPVRLGRLALFDAAAIAPGARQVLRRGVWLEHQRQVWVSVGESSAVAGFAEAAALHGELLLPGLLPSLVSGVTPQGIPYSAVSMYGEPLPRALAQLRQESHRLAECLRSGVELVSALALAGVTAPRLSLPSFVLDRDCRLWLASLIDCTRVGQEAALANGVTLAQALCQSVLQALGGPARERAVRKACQEPTLVRMARALTLAE